MPDAAETLRPAKLWKILPEERRVAAAAAFWADDQAVAEQAEATAALVRHLNFRPKSVMALPADRKARLLGRMGQISDTMAARLLVSYHLANQRPMMKAFLDALGLPHEDGLLNEDVTPPAREKIVEVGRQLFQSFPAEDVQLYFSTLLMQDPDTWGGLRDAMTGPGGEAAPAPASDTPAESN